MSVVINTNYAATLAANNLASSNQSLQRSLNRLSSGSKIVNPADDAGGLAVSMKLSATARRQGAVMNNLGNSVSFLQSQDGVLKTVGKVLERIGELKTLASDPTKNSSDLDNYNAEFASLQDQLTSLAGETFNGKALFGSTDLSVGATEDGTGVVTSTGIQLMGSPLFAAVSDSFGDLSNWDDNSSGGGSVYLNAGKMDLYGNVFGTGAATSKQSFSGAFQLTMDANITGGSHNFDVMLGGTNILSLDAGTYAGNNTVVIDYDGIDTITRTVNGVTTTQTGVGVLSGKIQMENTPNGDVLIDNFQISSASSSASVSAVTTASNLSSLSLNSITSALSEVATYRAQNGATQSRLDYATELLMVNKANIEAANSRIVDVDVAEESTQMARYNILVQAGTAMLSQANQSAQSALRLIG